MNSTEHTVFGPGFITDHARNLHEKLKAEGPPPANDQSSEGLDKEPKRQWWATPQAHPPGYYALKSDVEAYYARQKADAGIVDQVPQVANPYDPPGAYVAIHEAVLGFDQDWAVKVEQAGIAATGDNWTNLYQANANADRKFTTALAQVLSGEATLERAYAGQAKGVDGNYDGPAFAASQLQNVVDLARGLR